MVFWGGRCRPWLCGEFFRRDGRVHRVGQLKQDAEAGQIALKNGQRLPMPGRPAVMPAVAPIPYATCAAGVTFESPRHADQRRNLFQRRNDAFDREGFKRAEAVPVGDDQRNEKD